MEILIKEMKLLLSDDPIPWERLMEYNVRMNEIFLTVDKDFDYSQHFTKEIGIKNFPVTMPSGYCVYLPSSELWEIIEYDKDLATRECISIYSVPESTILVPSFGAQKLSFATGLYGLPVMITGPGDLSFDSLISSLKQLWARGKVDQGMSQYPLHFSNKSSSGRFGNTIVPTFSLPPGWWAYTYLFECEEKKKSSYLQSLSNYFSSVVNLRVSHFNSMTFEPNSMSIIEDLFSRLDCEYLDYLIVPFCSVNSGEVLLEFRRLIFERLLFLDDDFLAKILKSSIVLKPPRIYLPKNSIPFSDLMLTSLKKVLELGDMTLLSAYLYVKNFSLTPSSFLITDFFSNLGDISEIYYYDDVVSLLPEPSDSDTILLTASQREFLLDMELSGNIQLISQDFSNKGEEIFWTTVYSFDDEKFFGRSSSKSRSKWRALQDLFVSMGNKCSSQIPSIQNPTLFSYAVVLLTKEPNISLKRFISILASNFDPLYASHHRKSILGKVRISHSKFFFRKGVFSMSVFVLLHPLCDLVYRFSKYTRLKSKTSAAICVSSDPFVRKRLTPLVFHDFLHLPRTTTTNPFTSAVSAVIASFHSIRNLKVTGMSFSSGFQNKEYSHFVDPD